MKTTDHTYCNRKSLFNQAQLVYLQDSYRRIKLHIDLPEVLSDISKDSLLINPSLLKIVLQLPNKPSCRHIHGIVSADSRMRRDRRSTWTKYCRRGVILNTTMGIRAIIITARSLRSISLWHATWLPLHIVLDLPHSTTTSTACPCTMLKIFHTIQETCTDLATRFQMNITHIHMVCLITQMRRLTAQHPTQYIRHISITWQIHTTEGLVAIRKSFPSRRIPAFLHPASTAKQHLLLPLEKRPMIRLAKARVLRLPRYSSRGKRADHFRVGRCT